MSRFAFIASAFVAFALVAMSGHEAQAVNAPATAAPATAVPVTAAPAVAAPAQLSGEMKPYAWFPGRWACSTAVDSASAKDPNAAKLWVVVDAQHDALREEFSMATATGKPYRSDDTLAYDAKNHAYVRHSIDMNGTQIVLAAKAPYQRSMNFDGFVSANDGKLYRMRATVAIDAAGTQMTTATSFFHADTKSWVVQSTSACSKFSN